jgi:short-subunit dehydrogenase
LFVLVFNLELVTIGYIVREKEGIRTPFTVISAYVGTKFTLEGLSESIAYELEPFGIKVILIEPGAIGSNFMKASVLPSRALDRVALLNLYKKSESK